jgi:hypothetical protein
MTHEDVWMLVSLVGPAWTLLDGLGEMHSQGPLKMVKTAEEESTHLDESDAGINQAQ